MKPPEQVVLVCECGHRAVVDMAEPTEVQVLTARHYHPPCGCGRYMHPVTVGWGERESVELRAMQSLHKQLEG